MAGSVEKKESEAEQLNRNVIDSYWVNEPFSKINIVFVDNQTHYVVEEVVLDEKEKAALDLLVPLLTKELIPPEATEEDPSLYILTEAKRLTEKYKKSLGDFARSRLTIKCTTCDYTDQKTIKKSDREQHDKKLVSTPCPKCNESTLTITDVQDLEEQSWNRIFYYVVRDLAGYGKLDPIMKDPNIEDLSCNGFDKLIYVWHRKYESVVSNVKFTEGENLDNFIVKLAHRSGKHVSSAYPLLDAMLPTKDRLAATFMHEVSTFGSSFTIRKFRSDPLSIVDLITLGTLDENIAAYLWFLLENKISFMVIGGTGAGKTSMLNALISLIRPEDKIVTVEEIAELNTFHDNWVQLVGRESFRFGTARETSITLFDLVRLSLRYRPDYIVVGEVRGEEAYTLFQAVATGHGGLCTMHADSVDNAVKRLTSPPMNVGEIYVPLMNICLYISRTSLPRIKLGLRFGRRVRNIWEIVDFDNYKLLSEWSPVNDTFKSDFQDSYLLNSIAAKLGNQKKDLLLDLRRRSEVLRTMVQEGRRDQREVAAVVRKYYDATHGFIEVREIKSEKST